MSESWAQWYNVGLDKSWQNSAAYKLNMLIGIKHRFLSSQDKFKRPSNCMFHGLKILTWDNYVT